MSGEFLFELITKAQWSFDRKIRSNKQETSWSFSTSKFRYISKELILNFFFLVFTKWFNFSTSVTLSPNAERYLKQTEEKSSPISLHTSYV